MHAFNIDLFLTSNKEYQIFYGLFLGRLSCRKWNMERQTYKQNEIIQ